MDESICLIWVKSTFLLIDRCDDGNCVSVSVMCDHIPDCTNAEDENCGLYSYKNIRIIYDNFDTKLHCIYLTLFFKKPRSNIVSDFKQSVLIAGILLFK